MTVNDVIKHAIPILEGIRVPMAEIETIGAPVAGVIRDLKQCVVFMDSVEAEQAAKRAAAEEEEAAQQAEAQEEAAARLAAEQEEEAARKAAEVEEAEREAMNQEEKEEEKENDERADV